MKGWLVKLTEFAEMAKLTTLNREKSLLPFINDWKSVMDFLLKK